MNINRVVVLEGGVVVVETKDGESLYRDVAYTELAGGSIRRPDHLHHITSPHMS